jgi:hypothetical protein
MHIGEWLGNTSANYDCDEEGQYLRERVEGSEMDGIAS